MFVLQQKKPDGGYRSLSIGRNRLQIAEYLKMMMAGESPHVCNSLGLRMVTIGATGETAIEHNMKRYLRIRSQRNHEENRSGRPRNLMKGDFTAQYDPTIRVKKKKSKVAEPAS